MKEVSTIIVRARHVLPPSSLDERMGSYEQLLLTDQADDETLHRYHALATAHRQADRALACYDRILKKRPGNAQVGGLFIALCLQRKDYAAAMRAVEGLVARVKPDDALIDAGLAVRAHLGPEKIEEKAIDTLSLCMIVRDEAPLLGSCLHTIKPLVDEMVLVDTGSEDRTVDIGRLFGAHVHAFKWCEDFAAARNAALQHVAGDWALVLDADELIAPADFEALRQLIRSHAGRDVAFTIETRNYYHSANTLDWHANEGRYKAYEAGMGWFPSRKVRLFKRNTAVKFEFPVHERVDPALKRAGITIVDCDVPVHHYGHMNETRNQEKAHSYYRLGYAKLEEMKADPAAIRELAVQAGQLARWTEAIDLWRRLLDLRPDFPEALINMASAHWQLGDYRQSLEWSRRAKKQDSFFKEACFNLAVSLLMMGEIKQAVLEFENLTEQHPSYLAALFMQAAAYACQGEANKAHHLGQMLLQHITSDAMVVASRDLEERLRKAGLTDHAQAVNLTLGRILG